MMEDAHEAPRHRIAAAQLAQHIGRPVCFVGRLHKVWGRGTGSGPVAGGCCGGVGAPGDTRFVLQVHPSGKLFVLVDGEGKQATVELSEPVSYGPSSGFCF